MAEEPSARRSSTSCRLGSAFPTRTPPTCRRQTPIPVSWPTSDVTTSGSPRSSTNSAFAAEIHLTAVRPAHHREGIGRAMLTRVEERLAATGSEFLQVKTLSDRHPDPGYAEPRAFLAGHRLPSARGVLHPVGSGRLRLLVAGARRDEHSGEDPLRDAQRWTATSTSSSVRCRPSASQSWGGVPGRTPRSDGCEEVTSAPMCTNRVHPPVG